MIRALRRLFGPRVTVGMDRQFPIATRSRRRPRCAPRLEALEDRLPPGDWLLGALLGGPLWGSGLLAGGTDPWALEDELAGRATPVRWEAQPDDRAPSGTVDSALVFVPSLAPSGG